MFPHVVLSGRHRRAACHVAGGQCRRPCTSPHFLLFLFARLILLLATVHSSPTEEFRFVVIADVKVFVVINVYFHLFSESLAFLHVFLYSNMSCRILSKRDFRHLEDEEIRKRAKRENPSLVWTVRFDFLRQLPHFRSLNRKEAIISLSRVRVNSKTSSQAVFRRHLQPGLGSIKRLW